MSTSEFNPSATGAGSQTTMEDLPSNSRKLCVSSPTEEFARRVENISYEAPVFATAGEIRAAFDKAVKGAHDVASRIFGSEEDLIRYLSEIQSYMSERGANAHLRKSAAIDAGFEKFYCEFQKEHDIELSFRTVQYKIQQLRHGCEYCGRLNEDHKQACPLFSHIGVADENDADDPGTNGTPDTTSEETEQEQEERGNSTDGKHYWLSPPELLQRVRDELATSTIPVHTPDQTATTGCRRTGAKSIMSIHCLFPASE
jgi:hypothetical protein